MHDGQFLHASVMTQNIKQKYCIKFCQNGGNNQTETIQKIQEAFGDDSLSQIQIRKCLSRFKNGRMSVESEARPGRPSTSRNDEVVEKVRQNVIEDRVKHLRKLLKKGE